MPKVSAITCTYNRAHLIGKAIQSVLHQTIADFEYIIVDDGSTDNTEEIVASFHDPRLVYYRTPHSNGNLSKVRNHGLEKATGKYIAFLDSDDTWAPDKLACQIEKFESDPSIGFSYTNALISDQKNKTTLLYARSDGTAIQNIFKEYIRTKFVIYTSCLVFRRECLEQVGWFDPGQPDNKKDNVFIYRDFDFIVSLTAHFNACILYKPLVTIVKHAENISNRPSPEQLSGYEMTWKKALSNGLIDAREYKRILTQFNYASGMQLRKANMFNPAARFFLKCIQSNPFQLKSWLRLLLLYPEAIFHQVAYRVSRP